MYLACSKTNCFCNVNCIQGRYNLLCYQVPNFHTSWVLLCLQFRSVASNNFTYSWDSKQYPKIYPWLESFLKVGVFCCVYYTQVRFPYLKNVKVNKLNIVLLLSKNVVWKLSNFSLSLCATDETFRKWRNQNFCICESSLRRL